MSGDGAAALSYDANGNLTSDGSTAYVYDAENRLVRASGATNATLSYDPMGRLWQVSGGAGTTRLVYDGDRLVAEYNGAGSLLRRYVHGPGVDEPLVWYEGAGVGAGSRRYLHADHQGSVIAVSDAAGAVLGVNRYDPYGVPAASNLGRFGYTGQTRIGELGLFYYKARFYSPVLGRFLQTDPIGYEDDLNLYAYVGGDPVNRLDPLGREACPVGRKDCIDDPDSETPGQAPPGGHPVSDKQERLDEVVVNARKERRLGDERIDLGLPYPGEQYGSIEEVTVTAVRGKQERKFTCSDGSSGASNVLNAVDFLGADAAVHTHPNWADPSPGMDDGAIPRALGIPNYGISSAGAWVVEGTPSGFRVRLIAGRWGSSVANVQAAVRGYNMGGGKGSSSKRCTFQ